MKKRIFLPMARPWVFLFELPLIALLALAISFHDRVGGLLKLFPLEILVGGAILFLPLYFVRLLSLSTEEVRTLGLFTERDRALLNEGRTLVLTLGKSGKLRVEVYGKTGDEPPFAWQKQSKDYRATDFCMLRARAYGTHRSVGRILGFYGVPAEEIAAAAIDGFSKEYEQITVRSAAKESGEIEVRIRFDATIL